MVETVFWIDIVLMPIRIRIQLSILIRNVPKVLHMCETRIFFHSSARLRLQCFIFLVSVMGAKLFKMLDNTLQFSGKNKFNFTFGGNGSGSAQMMPIRPGPDLDPDPQQWGDFKRVNI
jgi:hypothetical protein